MATRLYLLGILFFGYSLAAVAKPPLPLDYRIWSDNAGHSTSARLVDVRGDFVYLQKEGSDRVIAVPLAKLHTADQKYVAPHHTDKIIKGTVTGVANGDMIYVRSDVSYTVRLDGIDAPEPTQDFGSAATKALTDKVLNKDVVVEWKQRDKEAHVLGHVLVDGVWVNKQLVDEGLAWYYKELNESPVLAQSEAKARQAKLGLWTKPAPVEPWKFREQVTEKQKIASASSSSPNEKGSKSTTLLDSLERVITHDDLGWTNREDQSKFIEYLIQKDNEAAKHFMAARMLTGNCTRFKKGEHVYMTDATLLGLVKLRRKGEIQEFWTNREAVQ